jgi:hypothetical protein
MKVRRTQVFKESWAHVRTINAADVEIRRHLNSGPINKLWMSQKEVDEDGKVADAFAKFWGMVSNEMKTASWFKITPCILPWFLIAALFTPTFEDFTDSGVGCTDDCLEPAIEEEI